MYRWSVFRELEGPTHVIRYYFYGFKAIQLAVFAGWIIYFGNDSGSIIAISLGAAAIALPVIVFGQTLHFAVFKRLGCNGVFYGNKLGYVIPWQDGFPFNLVRHPQYVGTLASIFPVDALPAQ